MRRLIALLGMGLVACGPSHGGNTVCGISAVAGPLALLDQFGVPRRTLSQPPAHLPEHVVVRIVAGPTVAAVVGRADSTVVIGIDGPLPPGTVAQFGVMIVDPTDHLRGVMLYDTPPVANAPVLGSVHFSEKTIPLLGLEVDLTQMENPQCPFFPETPAR